MTMLPSSTALYLTLLYLKTCLSPQWWEVLRQQIVTWEREEKFLSPLWDPTQTGKINRHLS